MSETTLEDRVCKVNNDIAINLRQKLIDDIIVVLKRHYTLFPSACQPYQIVNMQVSILHRIANEMTYGQIPYDFRTPTPLDNHPHIT